jgi:CelD/BcsL family acetyltransferase involved in cellulose biosynthesis
MMAGLNVAQAPRKETNPLHRAGLAEDRTSLHLSVHDGLDRAIDEIAAAGTPERGFFSRSWFEAALPAETGAQTIVMRRGAGEAVAALPVAAGRLGIKAVPGSYWPFRSLAVASDVTAAEFARLLAAPAAKRALGQVWRIGPIASGDPALRLIEEAAGPAGWRLIKRRVGTSFQVDFAEVAEGQWPRNSTLRRNRQLERKMAEMGPLEWASHSGPELDARLLDELAALEAKSWQGKSRDAKFLAPEHRRVWDGLIADPVQAARLRVQLLRIDRQLVAWRIQIEAGRMIYSIATSYDPAFRSLGPGIVLATRALVSARERGFARFDWGSGDSGYKQTLGARPGPDLIDCLLVRGPLAMVGGTAIERVWQRHETVKAPAAAGESAAGDDHD